MAILRHRTCPQGLAAAAGLVWVDSQDSQDLTQILDLFSVIWTILGPAPYQRLEQCELVGQDRRFC